MTEVTPGAEQAQHLVATLPDLPDPEILHRQAQTRLDGLLEIKMFIDAEIAKCEMFLGVKSKERPPVSVSDDTYARALAALAQGNGFQATATVARNARMAVSSAGRAMQSAHDRHHAHREKHGRKFKWRITAAGEEFLTGPGEQS